ncbi:MAG: hypothetical protein RJB38_2422 [Pseudomonadota bacterium]|jgi:hypothetical protein
MQKPHGIAVKLLIFLLFTWSLLAHSNEFRSPRSASLGGAGHANPLLNEAAYQNPSFASMLPVYSWSANFKALAENRGRAYNLSVLDGRSDLFQAVAAYTVRDEYSSLHLGVSKKLAPTLSVGVGGKFFFTKNSSAVQNFRTINASATMQIFDRLQAALILDNLATSSPAVDLALERQAILGTKIRASEHLVFYFDPRASLTKDLNISESPNWGYETGAEISVFKDFYFRLGKFRNISHPDVRKKSDGFGYGIGWVAPRISLDFAVERIQMPLDRLTYNWGFTLYF